MTMHAGAPISIRPLKAWHEYLAAEELQRTVWQMPDWRDAVPANLMITVNKNGGLVLGAFEADGRLVGLAFGFIGMEGAQHYKHCSHMLAVLPEYREQGIGILLKLKQREETLARGIDLMTWTYDPLQARNANLNLAHLGAIARRYVENAYGEMTDGLNAGLASDRFEAEWWLNAARVKTCVAGQPLVFDWDALVRAGAQSVFRVSMDARGVPRIDDEAELRGEPLLLEIPASLSAVKAASPDLAREWRVRTRAVFQHAFAVGYAAVGFVFSTRGDHTRAAYVLSHAPVETGSSLPQNHTE
jgi:predicted GNAT superfamily acetyltransferase